ncbi:hypothetical protein [Absidia glauca]|uniref:Uncharacterized protein n=1 Tax=Absidia glauca TaxID=4829 RepID=A0A168QZ10_ABSGL|nr:hypothetical protein [Absidia glauca]
MADSLDAAVLWTSTLKTLVTTMNQGDDDDDGDDESEDDYATKLETAFVSRLRSIMGREVKLHGLTDSASDGCGYRRSNYALYGQPVQIRTLLDAEHPI